MSNRFLSILLNRNFILISSLVLGFLIPKAGAIVAPYTALVLTVVMSFSISSINLNMLRDYKSLSKVSFDSIFYNYVIHGTVLLVLAYFFTDEYTFYGFVIIAATPPGVAVIPFTYIFKGDVNYSFKGFIGTYLASILITPLIISFFAKGAHIEMSSLIKLVIQVIIIPIIISRVLLVKPIRPITNKLRSHVVNFGFGIILFTAIALNSKMIIANINSIYISALILLFAIFILGIIFTIIFKNRMNKELIISRNLMLSVKSSGFSVATALVLFDHHEVAIPSAIMSVFVVIYLLFIDVFFKKIKLNS